MYVEGTEKLWYFARFETKLASNKTKTKYAYKEMFLRLTSFTSLLRCKCYAYLCIYDYFIVYANLAFYYL